MGSSFNTIQIQNRHQLDTEQFIKAFTEYMGKKGLVYTTEEYEEFSYFLAFSANSKWVTLSSPEYEIDFDSFSMDVEGLAKAMNTCCIGTCVFDSDISWLYLFDAPNEKKDTVAIGDPGMINELLGMEYSAVRGKAECWTPLLDNEKTWEKLTSIWNNDYVFAEEALSNMAPLLGIDSMIIMTDYSFWELDEGDISLLVTLYFHTA